MHHLKAVVSLKIGKQRKGRGFSPDELKAAGISVAQARKMQVPVDWKRQTSHDENVATLKAHLPKASAEAKA
jgi:ribosomal protein L13E